MHRALRRLRRHLPRGRQLVLLLDRVGDALAQCHDVRLDAFGPDGEASSSVWIGLYDAPTVVRVSATTNAILVRVTVDHPVYDVAATEHAVWAVHNLESTDSTADPPPGVVTRIAY